MRSHSRGPTSAGRGRSESASTTASMAGQATRETGSGRPTRQGREDDEDSVLVGESAGSVGVGGGQ